MPTYMRVFYYNQLAKVKKLEKEEQEKANSKMKKPSMSRPNIPKRSR